ncbi:MAG: hypothetical protein QXG00_06610 [Candidatus Woesearchaeota archaeon]
MEELKNKVLTLWKSGKTISQIQELLNIKLIFPVGIKVSNFSQIMLNKNFTIEGIKEERLLSRISKMLENGILLNEAKAEIPVISFIDSELQSISALLSNQMMVPISLKKNQWPRTGVLAEYTSFVKLSEIFKPNIFKIKLFQVVSVNVCILPQTKDLDNIKSEIIAVCKLFDVRELNSMDTIQAYLGNIWYETSSKKWFFSKN